MERDYHSARRIRIVVLGLLAGAIGLSAAARQASPDIARDTARQKDIVHATGGAELYQSAPGIRDDIARTFAHLHHQVREAVVVVAAEGWSFPRRLTEADLSNHGCTYDLEDDALTDSLIDTLAAAQFQVDPTPQRSFSASMAIYVYTEGKHLKLILERPFVYENGEPLTTGDARGTFEGSPVVAKTPLYSQILDLVRPLRPRKATYGCASAPK